VFAGNTTLGAFTGTPPFTDGVEVTNQSRRRIGTGLEEHVLTQPLEAAYEPVASSFRMNAVEIIASHLTIFGAIPEDAKSDHQNAMRERHNSFPQAVLTRFAIEESGQKAVLLAGRRPSRLAHRAAQPAVALAGSVAQPFAGTFAVTWTQAGPTGDVLGTPNTLISEPSSANRVHAVTRSTPGIVQSRAIFSRSDWGAMFDSLDVALHKLHLLH